MKVRVIATDDVCWENETNDYPMFAGKWAVEVSEGLLYFKKIIGQLSNGTPVLDLATCKRFEVVWDKGIPDLEWLQSATFLEAIEKFAK
ncbi:hypothetical protein ACIQX3_21295 [Peribacillus frigoritolerans]|uniref:hypothetical protein n=1 Tax=Peribacillus frigoritolerans TaxID=450367 RepID=UPI00382E02F6